jgi:DNA recombination protein RmuC
MDTWLLLAAVSVGVAVGAVVSWLLASGRRAAALAAAVAQAESAAAVEIARLEERLKSERESSERLAAELAAARKAGEAAGNEAAALKAELNELRTRTEFLVAAREELSNRFKTLANDILEEKTQRFRQENEASLGQILEPLKSRLNDFRSKVEEVYVQEAKDRSALAGQVQQLVELNQTLSQEAKNLTSALKGSSKAQGNWGELILERILEESGLRKGFEYVVQSSEVREDGSRAQPDVVIHLPEERRLVVDSKVSLTAYERLASAGSEAERAVHLRQHLDSVRSHVRGLSARQYETLYGLKSLDFVLAFVPIEPAFMVAVTNDDQLFMDAYRQNVLLVSPSTLLFVVRTVAHLWRQEAQKTNAQDIAKRGAELYDKLCGFVEDLAAVGQRLAQAQKAYEGAHAKLATGRGNVIRQAEMLRDMGVKPTKSLPVEIVDAACADEDAAIARIAAAPPPPPEEAEKAEPEKSAAE